MAVKRSASATRMLRVFERIASAQPIGVSALARLLEADKSAVQRDLVTLADAGWIRPAPGTAGQWELTPHMLTLARAPSSNEALRQRARPVLADLWRASAETVYLAVPHADHFVVIEALESPSLLRTVPPVGMIVPVEGSATARAVMAWFSAEEQARMLGREPDAGRRGDWAETRERGWAMSDGDIVPGTVTFASAVLDPAGRPVGAVVLTGPKERIGDDRIAALGTAIHAAARQIMQA